MTAITSSPAAFAVSAMSTGAPLRPLVESTITTSPAFAPDSANSSGAQPSRRSQSVVSVTGTRFRITLSEKMGCTSISPPAR